MNGLYILAMQCIGDTVSSKVFNWCGVLDSFAWLRVSLIRKALPSG